jgi:beta-glucosidase
MTNDEKSNLTYGYSSYSLAPLSACSGMTYSVPRLHIPGLCLSDAGNGLRGTDFVNAYPAGVHVAATWNRSLTFDRGLYMGREFKAKGGLLLTQSFAPNTKRDIQSG